MLKLILVITTLISLNSHASTLTCDHVQEITPSLIGADDLLHVSLTKQCIRRPASASDLTKIKAAFLQLAIDKVEVKRVANNEIYLGMPSTGFEVVESFNDHGQGFIFRQTHVANQNNVVFIESLSQKIEAQGDAKLTKKSDWPILATLNEQGLVLKFTETIFLQKKSLPFFKTFAVKYIKDDFEKEAVSRADFLSQKL